MNKNLYKTADKIVKFFESKKGKAIVYIVIALFFTAIGIYYIGQTQTMPQASIFLLNDIQVPKEGQKVLIFSPHPDDETLGSGGFIYDAVSAKATVKIVLVTDGNKYGLKAKRQAEFKKATTILGVPEKNLVFLNYSENIGKVNQTDIYDKIKQEIDVFNPDFIVYPDSKDNNLAHSTTGKMVTKIIDSENRNGVFYQYLIHDYFFYPNPYKYAPQDYLLPPWRRITFDKEWQRLILNENVEGIKTEAVLTYRSQFVNPFNRDMMLSPIRKNELFEIRK